MFFEDRIKNFFIFAEDSDTGSDTSSDTGSDRDDKTGGNHYDRETGTMNHADGSKDRWNNEKGGWDHFDKDGNFTGNDKDPKDGGTGNASGSSSDSSSSSREDSDDHTSSSSGSSGSSSSSSGSSSTSPTSGASYGGTDLSSGSQVEGANSAKNTAQSNADTAMQELGAKIGAQQEAVKAAQAAQQVADKTQQKAAQKKEELKEIKKEALEKLYLTDIKDIEDVIKTSSKISDTINEKIEEINHRLETINAEINEAPTPEAANEAKERYRKELKNLKAFTPEKAKWDRYKALAEYYGEQIAKKEAEYNETVKAANEAQQAANEAQQAADEATTNLGSAIDKANKAMDAYDKAKEAMSEAVGEKEERIKEGYNKAESGKEDAVNDMLNNALGGDDAGQEEGHDKDDIQAKAEQNSKEQSNKLKEEFKKGFDRFVQQLLVNDILSGPDKKSVTEQWRELADFDPAACDNLSNVLNDFLANMEQISNAGLNFYERCVEYIKEIKDFLGAVIDTLKESKFGKALGLTVSLTRIAFTVLLEVALPQMAIPMLGIFLTKWGWNALKKGIKSDWKPSSTGGIMDDYGEDRFVGSYLKQCNEIFGDEAEPLEMLNPTSYKVSNNTSYSGYNNGLKANQYSDEKIKEYITIIVRKTPEGKKINLRRM